MAAGDADIKIVGWAGAIALARCGVREMAELVQDESPLARGKVNRQIRLPKASPGGPDQQCLEPNE
jgi:hypothetical protein